MAEENKKEAVEEPIDIDSILETPSVQATSEQDDQTSDDTPHNDEASDEEKDEIANAEDDNEREAIRERRRLERQQKKEWRKETDERQRREREMLRKENQQLAGRLAALEQRAMGSEFAQLDNAISNTQKAIAQIKEQIKYATEAGDGSIVAEATEKLFEARNYAQHLQNIKQNAANQSRQIEQRSPVDPRVRQHAEAWAESNSWYDPAGEDEDSQVTKVIDQRMAAEGWNPQEPEYWDELNNRLKRYLPHRYQQQQRQQNQRQNRTPVASSGREVGSGNPMGSWRLSAERVSAIKEAGAWDDPVKRDKMIRNYRDYDKANIKK